MGVGTYQRNNLRRNWTRVELLLQIYDRAIIAVEACAFASDNNDNEALARHFVAAQKALLAIHVGLKPEEHEVAYNIARLIHFAFDSLEKREFDAARKVLSDLRNGYAAVSDEVNELEANGEIPPIPDDQFVY